MLLSKAIDTLLIATRAEGWSQATVKSYRTKLKPLLEFLGDADVADITTDDLRRYLADQRDRSILYDNHPHHEKREGSLSPHTIASRTRAFKRLFNFLVEEGRISHSPARRIKKPRPKPEPKNIDRQDIIALLKTCGDDPVGKRDRAIVMLLTDSAVRVGGLCNLRIQDIDLDAGLAWVCEKGNIRRLIPFSPPTGETLRRWLEVRPQEQGDWVFVSLGTRSKGHFTPNGVRHMLRRRARKAGIKGRVNPHAFRHNFGREYLLSGGDLGTLAEIMGHSSTTVTTDYYARFRVAELKDKHRLHSPIAGILGGGKNDDQ